MCCRYYFETNVEEQIQSDFRSRSGSFIDHLTREERKELFRKRDFAPSDLAPVLCRKGGEFCLVSCRWGYLVPGKESSLLINARVETVEEKPLFCKAMKSRRLVVPASGFYEWNDKKEKSLFFSKDSSLLYLAGLYDLFQGEERFVILTTKANESMKEVHDRMPLILSAHEVMDWIEDQRQADAILHMTPSILFRRTPYEQMNLF